MLQASGSNIIRDVLGCHLPPSTAMFGTHGFELCYAEEAGLHGTFIAERLFVQQSSAIVPSPMSCAASFKDFCCRVCGSVDCYQRDAAMSHLAFVLLWWCRKLRHP